jgi:cystathionine beta-lyase
MSREHDIETLLAHFGEDHSAHDGAVVPPLYLSSLFTFDSWDDIDDAFSDRRKRPIYSRVSNPTVRLVEQKIAAIAGAEDARLFGSGMAAIAASVMHCCSAGDHVIGINNVYGPANNLLNSYLKEKMNLQTTLVPGDNIDDLERQIRPETKLIYLESPSSAVFGMQDIRAVAALARSRGLTTMIDNTWATPLFQKPIEMGIDLSIHSVSKYLAGHSDIVAGVVIGNTERIDRISVREGELLGGIISPFDAWLLLRSLRTLPARMRQHQESAIRVARFLEDHPRVRTVRYPGLPSHPQYALGQSQMTGYSGLMGFELDSDNIEAIKSFFDSLKLFLIGVSWGGHESLIYAPAISYMKELPPEKFKKMGISAGSMRISVGLESSEDLIADLEQALEHLA